MPLFRPLAALAALALLAGCATPLERCVLRAEREVRILTEELAERTANVIRGYAIERRVVQRMGPAWCRDPRTGRPYHCIDWIDGVEEYRRPINVALERERVAMLERAVARERQLADRQIAACRAQYPQG
jgi:hypothetical protein